MNFTVRTGQAQATPSAPPPQVVERSEMQRSASVKQLEHKRKQLQDLLQHLQEAQRSGQNQGSQNSQEQIDDLLRRIEGLARAIKEAKADQK